jgi:predicted dehydrogenase
MRKYAFVLLFILACIADNCRAQSSKNQAPIKLIILDPGHFHAALVQKSMYDDVDSIVYVYAPKGPDVKAYLAKVNSYNVSPVHGTCWQEQVYLGSNFLERMISEKKGNAVVLAGNNRYKTSYIKKSVDAGFSVLGDKPMAIDKHNFCLLRKSFATAAKKKLVLYDIMTERYEITNALQREFAMLPAVFGTLKKGTPHHPGVEMRSIHYFYKYVSGSVLTRPAWAFDVKQQGEGLQDVGVHLVDLTQWECFPDKIINYKKDIQFNAARHWVSNITFSQFTAVTRLDSFPSYLHRYLKQDTVLKIYCNGQINYNLFGVNIKLTAAWAYKATEGGDSQYSILRGTKSSLVIKQGVEQHYAPVLYIEPLINNKVYEASLMDQLKIVQAKYPGINLKKEGKIWEVIIPDEYKDGHEAHFAKVTNNFLQYIKKGDMPKWEVPNMIAKYYTTTSALELAKKSK